MKSEVLKRQANHTFVIYKSSSKEDFEKMKKFIGVVQKDVQIINSGIYIKTNTVDCLIIMQTTADGKGSA